MAELAASVFSSAPPITTLRPAPTPLSSRPPGVLVASFSRAAAAELVGRDLSIYDFPGFGPHSVRRANITWRQEVGGSSIEASKIAGHANTRITEEYTVVQLKRQEELTRRIQDKRAKAAKRVKDKKVVEITTKEPAA